MRITFSVSSSLSLDVIKSYNSLDPDSKRRNVNAWRPVVVSILGALNDFSEDHFKIHLPLFYNEIVNLLLQDIPSEVRILLQSIFNRSGVMFGITKSAATLVKKSINIEEDELIQ